MSAHGIWGLVPVKPLALAKSRLAGVLDAAAREALARWLLEHVLTEIMEARALAGALVVTDCEEASRIARAHGAEVARDGVSNAPLGAIVDRGLAALSVRDAKGAVVLMSDLPRLASADVHALATSLDRTSMAIAPDRHDAGTNALALALPPPGPTCFGHADSFQRHLASAAARGIAIDVVRSEGLAWDVDVPEDLDPMLRDYALRGARLSVKRKRSSRVSAA